MGVTRRHLLKGAAGLPLAAILADPLLARAAASGLQTVTINTAGGRNVSAALALPDAASAPAIILIHEWWGLNDQIKTMAAEFAKAGYVVLAVDLYGGNVAATPEDAKKYMGGVKAPDATDTLTSWAKWLRAPGNSQGKANGRLATVGWCFGGGWSLNASIAAPIDATVIYYGRVNKQAADLKSLKGPVLGHFATKDAFIDRKMVGGFEAAMTEAGKKLTTHWYEADHAFANPSGGRYDRDDARLAWQRTLAFLKKEL